MLNVAISRAQDSFLVFGNMDLFSPSSPDHPSRLLGKYLFKPENEITDVLPALRDVKAKPFQSLISDLQGHRSLLRDAFTQAEKNIVIVSPFLTRAAFDADGILALVKQASDKGVSVEVYTDRQLNEKKVDEFRFCVSSLQKAGANVYSAIAGQGVHSKLLWFDGRMFATGSFNWLSAVRSQNSKYQRHETSAVFEGKYAARMIEIMSPEVVQRSEPIKI